MFVLIVVGANLVFLCTASQRWSTMSDTNESWGVRASTLLRHSVFTAAVHLLLVAGLQQAGWMPDSTATVTFLAWTAVVGVFALARWSIGNQTMRSGHANLPALMLQQNSKRLRNLIRHVMAVYHLGADPEWKPARSHQWVSRRWRLVFWAAAVGLAIMAVRGLPSQSEALGITTINFVVLLGSSALVSICVPAFITWLAFGLVLGSGSGRGALSKAGDLAGRGVVAGAITGVLTVASSIVLPVDPTIEKFLSTDFIINCSVLGSMVGFGIAGFILIWNSASTTANGWFGSISVNIALPVATYVTAAALSPSAVMLALSGRLTRGLSLPDNPETYMSDAGFDWRVTLIGQEQLIAAMVPDRIEITTAVAIICFLNLLLRLLSAHLSTGAPQYREGAARALANRRVGAKSSRSSI
ncbi:hypothetical protein ABLI39_09345 [Pseudarthrobacter sp. B907]|uniref:hypothetical protein n=1 Tax=Pseudarthrobacter sp. B907 TaxID=3158261 RepID=UPI0032DAA512